MSTVYTYVEYFAMRIFLYRVTFMLIVLQLISNYFNELILKSVEYQISMVNSRHYTDTFQTVLSD